MEFKRGDLYTIQAALNDRIDKLNKLLDHYPFDKCLMESLSDARIILDNVNHELDQSIKHLIGKG
ncbi:hypothetical protein HMSSN036_51730 [Paenibacillus macerans]|nr:hypothetical protein HMSSN036_51730 [Paenibacillus macerans]